MKLIMTKGLPASGKTTWAKTQNSKRINKDDLRAMIDNGKWSRQNEKEILQVRNMLVEFYLKNHDVIVDDTNLAPKHEDQLQMLAVSSGAEFVVQDFINVSIDECIERDRKRPNYVGETVIRKMYKDFLEKKAIVKINPNLPNAVICDLDGTLCLFGDKNPYDRDFENDDINSVVRGILQGLPFGTQIIFSSGRNDKYREITQSWLNKYGMNGMLIMRKDGDVRKDNVIKLEMYEEFIKNKYNVLFVLDDRDQVVRLWRSLGLTCLQVADGNF